MSLRRAAALLVALVLMHSTAGAQSLRERIPQLFQYGGCGQPLCLAGSLDQGVHGNHFIGAAASANQTVLDFLSDAVGVSLGNIPISAASSGATFTFVDGVPVKTSSSAGPVFGERAPTLGRRRLLVGANVTSINFTTLRGRPIKDLNFNFTHEDTDPTGPDNYGDPAFENDYINANVALDLNLLVTTAYMTYGLFDRVDIGVAVPYVYTTMQGSAIMQVIPAGTAGATPHYFAGTQTNPIVRVGTNIEGSATGIGDIATRLKWNLSQAPAFSLSLLADARLATGDEDNFLGSGQTAVRGLAVMSGQYGTFSPHLNAGYLYRGGENQNNALLATIGFDALLSSWATLAGDIITEQQIGDNGLQLPGPVVFDTPFPRVVEPTDIPNKRDNLASASLGMKFTTQNGVRIVVNGIFPLARAGLQPDVVWTSGLEYTF
jgi:hypothetical protein